MSGALYVDLDGTLLGRGGALLRDGDGAVSLLGVRALEACLRAGVEVVPTSGRRRAQVAEDARLFSASAFIWEAGAVLELDGEQLWLTGDLLPGELSVREQIERSGAPALLLEHFGDQLEYHSPWHLDREVSHLFRGRIEAATADALLREHGHGSLRLVDNGAAHIPGGAPEGWRVYHLVPASASKAQAVARHIRARGLDRAQTFAVGDSREDLAIAPHVETFWLVANALDADPSLRDALAEHPNVCIAEAGHGAGVYEAVITTLAGRR